LSRQPCKANKWLVKDLEHMIYYLLFYGGCQEQISNVPGAEHESFSFATMNSLLGAGKYNGKSAKETQEACDWCVT
jgi:hypothetical protein